MIFRAYDILCGRPAGALVVAIFSAGLACSCSSFTSQIATSNSTRSNEKVSDQPTDDDNADASAGSKSQIITGTNLDELLYGTAAAYCLFDAGVGTLGGMNCQTANTEPSGPRRVSKREAGLNTEWRVNADDEIYIQCPTARKNVAILNCQFTSNARPSHPVRIYLTLIKDKERKEVASAPLSPSSNTGGGNGTTTGSSSSGSSGGGQGSPAFSGGPSYLLFISKNSYFQGSASMTTLDYECQSNMSASTGLIQATGYNKARALVGMDVLTEANPAAFLQHVTQLGNGAIGVARIEARLGDYTNPAFRLTNVVEYSLPSVPVGSVAVWTGWRTIGDPEGNGMLVAGSSCDNWS